MEYTQKGSFVQKIRTHTAPILPLTHTIATKKGLWLFYKTKALIFLIHLGSGIRTGYFAE